MNIGQAAHQSGVTAKMIRYYEVIGLLPKAARRDSGYRDYDASDVHRLAFVRRARELGFTIDQIRELLSLWSDLSRSNAEVRAVARRHLAELEEQARKLEEMIETLNHLIGACQRGDRPHCPIIMELGGGVPQGPQGPHQPLPLVPDRKAASASKPKPAARRSPIS